MKTSYRDVLKQETRLQHARVDDAMSTLNLTQPDGLIRFLAIHRSCFKAMGKVARGGTAASACLAEMDARIQRDLDGLNAPRIADVVHPLSDIDPLGLDYMLEGSRLGSQILRRRWASATDPKVRAADAYFSLDPVPGRWREVCDQLAAIPVHSSRAASVTSGTRELFDMFYRVTTESNRVAQPNMESIQ